MGADSKNSPADDLSENYQDHLLLCNLLELCADFKYQDNTIVMPEGRVFDCENLLGLEAYHTPQVATVNLQFSCY